MVATGTSGRHLQGGEVAGFDVEDATQDPLRWDVAFETTGEKWLGISVPFIGDEPQTAVVDT